MSGNVWNPDQTRIYPDNPGTEKLKNTPINPGGTKTDYSSIRGWHPDNELNQEYIDAGAASDTQRPLCFGVHEPGIPCRRPVTWREGSRYCNKGKGG
jgi:hypothetical protein